MVGIQAFDRIRIWSLGNLIMQLTRISPADFRYQRYFGQTQIDHFNVIVGSNQSLGQVTDVFLDEFNNIYILVTDRSQPDRLVPLSNFQLSPADRHILLAEGIQPIPWRAPAASANASTTAVSAMQPVEISAPLENSAALEGQPIVIAQQQPSSSTPMPAASSAPINQGTPIDAVGQPHLSDSSAQPHLAAPAQFPDRLPDRLPDPVPAPSRTASTIPPALSPAVLHEEIIPLLEERLVVRRQRHKVGEIIVRKVVETRMIQVPIRRERLVIEQISPERRELASIDLSELGTQHVISAPDFDRRIPATARERLIRKGRDRQHGTGMGGDRLD